MTTGTACFAKLNAEATGPYVAGVATVAAVTDQPHAIDADRSERYVANPAALAAKAAEARETAGAGVAALTSITTSATIAQYQTTRTAIPRGAAIAAATAEDACTP